MTDDPAARWRHIEIVLDRSGSMHPIAAQTEAGLRGFLEAQAEVPGRTTVSLYQFDHVGELVFSNVELADVPDVRLQPRGATALFDAIGDTIERARNLVLALPKPERPDEIITVILTDGAENSSHRYDAPRLRASIENLQAKKRKWVFVLLGAGFYVTRLASMLGIPQETTIHYDHDLSETALSTAGEMVRRGSRSGLYGFTDEDRTATRH